MTFLRRMPIFNHQRRSYRNNPKVRRNQKILKQKNEKSLNTTIYNKYDFGQFQTSQKQYKKNHKYIYIYNHNASSASKSRATSRS